MINQSSGEREDRLVEDLRKEHAEFSEGQLSEAAKNVRAYARIIYEIAKRAEKDPAELRKLEFTRLETVVAKMVAV